MLRTPAVARAVVLTLVACLGGCDCGNDQTTGTIPTPIHHHAGSGGATGAAGSAGAPEGGACSASALAAYTSTDDAAVPPEQATDQVAPTGAANIQAMHHLWIGDTDRTGAASADAWKTFGFDITGYDEDGTFPCGCTAPKAGGTPRGDGDHAIKNSFGKNVVPSLALAAGSGTINTAIAGGGYSFVLDVASLGTGKDQGPLSAQLFNTQGSFDAGKNAIALTDADWTAGTYLWHPLPETLQQSGAPQVTFASAYLTGGTFVSGPPADIPVTFSLMNTAITVTIAHAVLTLDIAADGKTGTNGTIAGVLRVADAEQALKATAGQLGDVYCSLIQGILDTMEQSADIMSDGTLGTGMTCDAISVGIGFDTNAVATLGDNAPPSTAVDMACP